MRNCIILMTLLVSTSIKLIGQTIETIKDPGGHDVILALDSAFLLNTGDALMFYTLDQETNTRNVLLTDGIESTWLVPGGFSTQASFYPFTRINEEQFVFRGGNIWYRTDVQSKSTEIFYNNDLVENQYAYLRLYASESVNGLFNNLIIEAKDKTTGDTIILFHRTENFTTEPFGKKMRIYKAEIPSIGSLSGNLIIASVFDEGTQTWGEVSLYREYSTNLKRLLPLGNKTKYDINLATNAVTRFVVDHLEDGTKRAYRYVTNTDTCLDITSVLFPDHTLMEFQNLKWTSYGHPLEPPISYNDYYWQGRNQSNELEYFTSAALEDEDIADLKNVTSVDFLYSSLTPDSIYYYNYSNTQRGLMRYHKYNGGTKKDPTSSPFNQEFKLKGYLDKMYFGRYNSQSDRIEAMVKNFPTNSYAFIQSADNKRIENPLDFEFIENKVFVISRTSEGRKLVVFDPNGIVATQDPNQFWNKVTVFPNPGTDRFNVHLADEIMKLPQLTISLVSIGGLSIGTWNITEADTELIFPETTEGTNFISLKSGNKQIYSTSVVIMN